MRQVLLSGALALAIPAVAEPCPINRMTYQNELGDVINVIGYAYGIWEVKEGRLAGQIAHSSVLEGEHNGKTVYLVLREEPFASGPSRYITADMPGERALKTKVAWTDPSKPAPVKHSPSPVYVDYNRVISPPEASRWELGPCRPAPLR